MFGAPLASSTSELLTSISHYLWPVLVALLLVALLPAIREVLKTRAYKVTVGSVSVDVQTASDGLQKQITDLQNQVAQLKERPSTAGGATTTAPGTIQFDLQDSTGGLLWVDDNPENNIFEIQSLEEKDILVRTATDTTEAMKALARRKYDAVITDLGRLESGSYKAEAGLDLVRTVREKDKQIPLYVFTTADAVTDRHTELIEAGATAVTSSSVQLLAMLGVIGAGAKATDAS
jgi:CheY-like chemotaxis protein